jgi:hypothetical protein
LCRFRRSPALGIGLPDFRGEPPGPRRLTDRNRRWTPLPSTDVQQESDPPSQPEQVRRGGNEDRTLGPGERESRRRTHAELPTDVQNRQDVIAMKRVAQRFWAPCGYEGSSLVQIASTSHYRPLGSISIVEPQALSEEPRPGAERKLCGKEEALLVRPIAPTRRPAGPAGPWSCWPARWSS